MAEENKIDWREVHKKEAVDFVRSFYRTCYDWRRQAYHTKWDTYERNYRNIYDPGIKARKKPWQAAMFIPATVTNVEVIVSALTKIGSGKRRSIGLEPREMGDELQSELNNDLMDYYLEKGDYAVSRYDCVKEAGIFGSGFMKLFWEKKYAKRRTRQVVMESFVEAVRQFRFQPQPKGFEEVVQDVLVKNGIRFQPVHIRDIFLEPNSTDGQRLIHRDRVTYNELQHLADQGFLDKESVDQLWMVKEGDSFEEDVRVVKQEQSQTDPNLGRPGYDKQHTAWEYWGPLPLKWINLDMPEDTEEQKRAAAEVTPGKILVASGYYFLGSEENPNYAMEPNFLQMDYIRSGQTYGIGVAQLMEGLQEELNEVRNQRIDNVSLLMNKVFVAIEKYVVDPKDVKSEPGNVIRLKGSEIDDVRKVFTELPISDVPLSAFRETAELERQIQETTAANKVTITGSGQDMNGTLGGMELAKQAAFDRFTVIAFIIGRRFDVKVAKKCMELIYQNIDDESVRRILGMEPVEFLPGQFFPRWELWKRQTPEEMDICYDYVPVDVFSEENKFQKSQDLMSWGQFLASTIPGWNPMPLAKKLGKLKGFSTEEITEIMGGIDQVIPTPMGMGQGVPSISKPTKQATGETPPMPQTPEAMRAAGLG